MGSQLIVDFIEVEFDDGVLDCASSARLGHSSLDVVLSAGVFEGVHLDELSGVEGSLDVGRCRTRIAWPRTVGSVVGEDGVNFIRDGSDRRATWLFGPARARLRLFLPSIERRTGRAPPARR
jgi:hypothetical protein